MSSDVKTTDSVSSTNATGQETYTTLGQCFICRKSTKIACKRCGLVYYCGSKHSKQHWPVHKPTCKQVQKELVKNRDGDIWLVDLCVLASHIFGDKYLVPSHSVGFNCWDPVGIKDMSDGNKYVLLKEVMGMGAPESRKLFKERGYSEGDFWSTFHVGKATIFHCAFVLALIELRGKGVKIWMGPDPEDEDFDDEKKQMIDMYGIADVKVKQSFTPIVPTYDWSSEDVAEWKCDKSCTPDHKPIWVRTAQGTKFWIDFTASQFGIGVVNEDGFPMMISNMDHIDMFELERLRFSFDVQNIVQEMFNTGQMEDPRPAMIVGSKNLIVQGALLMLRGHNAK